MSRFFKICEELNITYVAFSPMINGAITGAYKSKVDFGNGDQDFRVNIPQYSEAGMRKTSQIVEFLDFSKKYHETTQILLTLIINKKDFIISILGSGKIERLQQNFDIGQIKLSIKEIKIIDDKLDTMEFMVFGGHAGK